MVSIIDTDVSRELAIVHGTDVKNEKEEIDFQSLGILIYKQVAQMLLRISIHYQLLIDEFVQTKIELVDITSVVYILLRDIETYSTSTCLEL